MCKRGSFTNQKGALRLLIAHFRVMNLCIKWKFLIGLIKFKAFNLVVKLEIFQVNGKIKLMNHSRSSLLLLSVFLQIIPVIISLKIKFPHLNKLIKEK